mmetsp:Transcript_6079/g.23635  ORF Transcript_6079/g.23635 Transcript_6079/m.23635 type:complete len:261 (+) Transcript_6079:2661-3443(+)
MAPELGHIFDLRLVLLCVNDHVGRSGMDCLSNTVLSREAGRLDLPGPNGILVERDLHGRPRLLESFPEASSSAGVLGDHHWGHQDDPHGPDVRRGHGHHILSRKRLCPIRRHVAGEEVVLLRRAGLEPPRVVHVLHLHHQLRRGQLPALHGHQPRLGDLDAEVAQDPKLPRIRRDQLGLRGAGRLRTGAIRAPPRIAAASASSPSAATAATTTATGTPFRKLNLLDAIEALAGGLAVPQVAEAVLHGRQEDVEALLPREP